MSKVSLADSGIKAIVPYGDNVLLIKDEEDAVSRGGIVIPEAHRGYKRRGWVLATGAGYRAPNGETIPVPFKPGDYLIADRPYARTDESEDELFHDPTIIVVRGDEAAASVRACDCEGKQKLPEKFKPLIEKFGNTGTLKAGGNV